VQGGTWNKSKKKRRPYLERLRETYALGLGGGWFGGALWGGGVTGNLFFYPFSGRSGVSIKKNKKAKLCLGGWVMRWD